MEQLADAQLESMREAVLDYKSVMFLFLPEEVEALENAFGRAVESTVCEEAVTARLSEFSRLVDALDKTKASYAIKNHAVALSLALDVFEQNLMQQAVSKMLIRVEQRTLKEMSGRVKGVKVQQTASLRKIFREAMAAWEESKKPQKSLTTKQGQSGDNGEPGKVRESVSVLRDQDSDPRYLDQARQALADIRKIWGVDEPAQTKNDISGRLGLEIVEEIIDADDSQDGASPSGTASVPQE